MSELQQQASDPSHSVWVSASAGTGKTKILTDRVLRLLISNNTPFDKILCLTFTNTAAFEMQNRIRSKLAHFASIEDAELTQELSLLLARAPIVSEIQTAKILYHQLLNSSSEINIYTIHAFCQKLLKLFSFEAGINPGFEILDDITALEILRKIRNQIYLDPKSNDLIHFFLNNFHEVTINDIFSEILQHKIKFQKLFAKKINNIEDLGLTFGKLPDSHSLKQKKLYDKVRNLSAKYSLNIENDEEILHFFLTKDFIKRKKLLSKSISLKHPELLKELIYLQEEIFQCDQQQKLQRMQTYSKSLILLANIFLKKYNFYKAQYNLLDYDDLIYHTQLLLDNAQTKNWVLYKLDGWISHLMVDEAQDTSKEQWHIINSITSQFYSSTKRNSTIFIVGDEKQSIFSFQGANLDSFNSVNKNLQKDLSKANKNFKNITLEWSYRSTKEIIDIVYIILDQIKNSTPSLFFAENPKILPFRKQHQGKVELWPLIKKDQENKLFWPLPENYKKPKSTKTILADEIANYIKQQILSKKILPSTNSPIQESDFMILVRKRDDLVFEIINSLKKYKLQVEDIDKVILNQNLSVMDLISIAKFVLFPQDDLNLASLLKSPIIGMKEEELQNLSIARGKNSLWLYLSSIEKYETIYDQLRYFLNIYNISHCGSFFSLIVDCFNIRKILVKNNGYDSNDLINELLYLSFNYANNIDTSLQSFVYWFKNNTIEVKRNLEGSNKIKIMTVHASKGLQSPIVILCDTTVIPTNTNKFIWDQDGEIFSTIQVANSPEFFKILKEKQQQKELQEYIRLMYVAMTRAEDHLIICGYQTNNNKLSQHCWYELIFRAMNKYGKLQKNNIIVYQTTDRINDQCNENINRTIDYPLNELDNKKQTIDFKDKVLFNKILGSSKQNYPAESPLTPINKLEYGKIFHKILEDTAKINNFSLLSKHPYIKKLPQIFQLKIQNNIDKLLHNKEFMLLESQELKTEISLGINLNNDIKVGRIDLLAIQKEIITIIDYKTDINPPAIAKLINKSYIDQINFYRHMIKILYPNKEISCKILWLENGNFMNI